MPRRFQYTLLITFVYCNIADTPTKDTFVTIFCPSQTRISKLEGISCRRSIRLANPYRGRQGRTMAADFPCMEPSFRKLCHRER